MEGINVQQHGPWTILESRDVYQDSWVGLRLDQVIRPDGQPGTFTTVRVKPGVCVIAVDDKQNVYLTKEFHFAVGRITLEGVSGGVEVGESPLASAQRELREELGILAKSWTCLGVVDPFTSAVLSPTQLFLAQDLSFIDKSPEGTELIETICMSLSAAVEAVLNSQITHAASCVTILKIALELKTESS